ncbi:hypothetical protein [Deinococcus sp. Leaf326]|uniref:hypothetical protein n=1 Tax=Deinococcus sp. Leaf326 TaxID=1736338 RepID=UPI001F15C4A9|nr:hypothetical protein [Deinococcus sp. Leaf326]
MRRLLAGAALIAPLVSGSVAGADVVLDGRSLRFEDGDRVVWQRDFAPELGPLTAPVTFGGNVYVGVGPVVYALTPGGQMVGRADLPGTVSSLDSSGGVLRVSTQEEDYTERFTLGAPQNLSLPVQERVVFPPDPAVTGWLAATADRLPVADVPGAARQDPANPFLLLRAAQLAGNSGDSYAALSGVRRALGLTLPFPVWTQLAARLDAAGFSAAATLALDRARRDAAARGLDPELPVSRAALYAYGNPSNYVSILLDQGRLGRAETWMNHLRELSPRFEGASALYLRYAALLEAQDRVGEAEEWREFTRSLRAGSLYNLGPDDTLVIRDVARLAALTLLLALGGALLTLLARAWRAQGQDTRAHGGRVRSVWRRPLTRARLSFLSYASFGERLVVALLGAALLTALGGWQWANGTGRGLNAPALNIGTYGGGWYDARLGDLNLRPGPDAALLTGLNAQLSGDGTAARAAYTQAGDDACALNNLGVIAQGRDDAAQARELYRSALATQPDLAAPAYNLGLNPTEPGTLFQQTYRRGEPRLCYPDRRILARAVSGDLSDTLVGDLRRPLDLLGAGEAPPTRLGAAFLTSLLGLGMLGLLLLVPRAAGEARLGRPAAYRLTALLLPGSALLGGAWGGVLLLTWALALAGLSPLTGLIRFAELPSPATPAVRGTLILVLVLSYAVNLLAVLLVEASVLARRRQEQREQT